ncbi:unnamed protein product [Staurois parvus]|uniref:Uncharacterized protein n=1 Tax=Staurois parvus TaxID=386267 RepID=A0ABN9BPZ6_9NEOB|nr:unnamed protein product [Staurois parvus]
MALGRKGLTSGAIKGLTCVCCVCASLYAHCFAWLCYAQAWKAVCRS